MKTKDYKNFDTLTLYVKKTKAEQIKEYYKIFKWNLIEEKENDKYADIVDLTFSRPHKIENKDELQLNQVYLEENINELAKLENRKHSKSLIFGLSFAIVILILLIQGILFVVNFSFTRELIWGIVLIFLSVLLIVGLVLLLIRIFKNENVVFNAKQQEITSEINSICSYVVNLGGDYE